jgi:amidase
MLTVWHGSKEYTQFLGTSWLTLRVGFLEPGEWMSSVAASKPLEGYIEQVISETEAAIDKISQQGGVAKKWVNLRRFGGDSDDDYMQNIGWHDYAAGFSEFIAQNFEDSAIHTMQNLIDFNNEHSDQVLLPSCPKQDTLIDAVLHQDEISSSQYEESWKNLRHTNREAVEVAMSDNDIDIIIGAPTGRFPTIAAAAGYPSVTLPLGYSKQNGRAFGLMGVVRANREDLLVSLTSAWEASFGAPKPPPQLCGDEISRI